MDSGPVDANGLDAEVNVGAPAGSPCTVNSECSGPNELCLADGLYPLSALASSDDPTAQTFAALGLPLPGGYCSTVPSCTSDAQCGVGGTCFFPLRDVPAATLAEGVAVLGLVNQADRDIFLSFGTYGQCLQACDSDTDCTRPGYRCVAPLNEFVGLIGGDTESTFCVGTNESSCTDFCVNGTCVDNTDGIGPWTCECEAGYEGANCDMPIPGLCPFFDVTAPLQVSATGYDEGEIATYSCEVGFSLVGTATRTCQADGSWSGTAPTCMADPCAGIVCANGGTCDGSSGTGVCTGCNAGWSGTLCDVPVDCGALSATAPLMVSATTTTLDSVATYTCGSGKVLTGSATRTCQSDGQWSGSAPTCEDPPPTCTPNPCINGGTCVADGSGNFASCDCASGWTGATCAVPVTCPVLTPSAPLSVGYSNAQDTDSVATYSCGAGYTLTGTPTRTCVDAGSGTGMWSGSEPTCQRITCPVLTITAPLQADTMANDFGTTVNYSCATGYALANGAATSATCGAAGWSPSALPTCQIVTCPALTNPANGTVDDGTNEYNTVAAYSCNSGFEVTGGTQVRCSASGTWTGTAPTCSRVACATRNAPANGTITPSSGPYVFGDSITYACNNGFSLSGGAAMQDCLASGSWSSTAPTCSAILCPALTDPANGTVDAMSRTPGTVAGYSCSAGYQLTGGSAVTCQANGTWMGTPPTCVLRDCGAPPAANANGTSMVPGATTVGATTTYACNVGYTGGGTLTCQAAGTWSAASAPACTIVSCGAPPTVANGTVGAGANTYNSTRTYTCDSGYQIASGSGTVTCLASASWTTPPTCQPIPNGCATNPCLNGGTCTENMGTFTGCTGCNAGYSGMLCEVPVDCNALTVANGTVAYSPMNTTLGSVATTTCNMGYTRSGPASRTCQSNGSWSGAANTCVPVSCGAAPDGTNSTATETSTTLGGVATYTCAAGYVVSGGDASRTCQANGTWSGTALSCALGDCGAPLAAGANASVATPGGTNTGDVATYSCNVGYTSAGGVASRTCQVNAGTAGWTPGGASLSCNIVSCGAPPSGTNAMVSFTTTNYNDTAMYTCNVGFAGGPSTITCQANGTWSGPGLSCTPVSCGAAPAANANGSVSGSGTTYNSTRMYSCNAGYQGGGTLTCLASGNWSGGTPPCTLADPYCMPTAPANGAVSGGTTIGSTATYTCNVGYAISSGSAMRTCNAGPTLSGTQPVCSPVDCGLAPDGTNSTATETSTQYNGLATYTCNAGYVVSGGNAMRTCGANGMWSGSPLSCVIGNCGAAPAAGANATLTMMGGTTTGATATYACNAGSGMGTGVTSRTCAVTGGVAGWTPSGASLACVVTPNTCTIEYALNHTFQITNTSGGLGDGTFTNLLGTVALRFNANASNQVIDGNVDMLFYWSRNIFTVSSVSTNVHAFAPSCAGATTTPGGNPATCPFVPATMTAPVATGMLGGNTITWGPCTGGNYWASSASGGSSYTPATNASGGGCINNLRSVGNVNCGLGLFCGSGGLSSGNNPQDATWNQPMMNGPLATGLNTLTVSADRRTVTTPTGNTTNSAPSARSWNVPNTAPSRTWSSFVGTARPTGMGGTTCAGI